MNKELLKSPKMTDAMLILLMGKTVTTCDYGMVIPETE
jgi:hypothetical protein